jgi:vacuolar-type H+-ATPase subunit I/STV1
MSADASDKRNWLDRLTSKIPGYSGYVDRERRRDIDKLHREHLADRLRRFKTPLTEFMKELSSTGRLFEVSPVDSAIKKLDQLENRVRFASYGYSGFFDVVKIEQAQLDSIYQFDLALVERVDKIESEVNELKTQSATAAGLKTAAAELAAAIDETGRAFDDRYKAINNFGQEQPPGRPLFQ